MTSDYDWVRIERMLDAPIKTVWSMWTNPELFQSWYGPKGMSIPALEMDLRVGGTRRVCMQSASGEMKMWFTGVFKEIVPPHRLVYTESMCDEHGTIIPPSAMGMPKDLPDITEVTVQLEDVGGTTRMTMAHSGVIAGTAGDKGWQQAFDKLAEELSTTTA